MTTQTVKEVLGRRLTRGTRVQISDSFGRAELRSKKMVVASKGPVKCNGKGRCAGGWCIGLAIFVAPIKSLKQDKEMGWRGGTTKVCLTHVMDKDGELVLAQPALDVAQIALAGGITSEGPSEHTGLVTWEDLAQAAEDGNLSLMTLLARKLKRENEDLKVKMIESLERRVAELEAR